MIQYICDMCGKTLNKDKDLLQLVFDGYALAESNLRSKIKEKNLEIQLCVDCAYSIYRHIKLKREDKGDGKVY